MDTTQVKDLGARETGEPPNKALKLTRPGLAWRLAA